MTSVRLMVVCLFLLFLLTFLGTIDQVSHGLYLAQEKFFFSFFFLLFGFIPFPGAHLVLWVLFINLACVAIFRFVYRWSNIGILIIHGGLLIFFVAAFVTYHNSVESHVTLFEGEGASVSSAYHDWELSVWKKTNEARNISAYDVKNLKKDGVLSFDEFKFNLTVKDYYTNSKAFSTREGLKTSMMPINASGISFVEKRESQTDPAKNIPALTFFIDTDELKGKEVLLFGGEPVPTEVTVGRETYCFILRHKQFPLPFALRLVDFRMKVHPGTEVASSYESTVEIITNGIARERIISMNNPLRHKDYTFYQASYSIDELGREVSTLATVKNVTVCGQHYDVYWLSCSLPSHVCAINQRAGKKIMKRKIPIAFIIFIALFSFAFGVGAAYGKEKSSGVAVSTQILQEVAILDSGRIKPLDTYAQNVLLQFSGKRRFEGKSALVWLARVLFTPEKTKEDKIFRVNNPEIAEALKIDPEPKHRYSYAQMEKGYDKLRELATEASRLDEKSRSVVEEEIIRLATNVDLYIQLTDSFQFAIPSENFAVDNNEVREYLKLPTAQTQFSFLDLALRADLLSQTAEALEKKAPASWTAFDREILRVLSILYQWARHYHDLPLAIIPPLDLHEEIWASPWDALAQNFHDEKIKNELTALRNAVIAYRNGEKIAFDLALRSFNHSVKERTGEIRAMQYLSLELLYTHTNPFGFALLFYLTALCVLVAAFFTAEKYLYSLSACLIVGGFIPHTLALITRIVILARPPVSSLYETFIFVGWAGVLLGIILEILRHRWLGIIVSGTCGSILLIIASKFSTDGDTLKMLVAVLNSNFWLGIHVPTITLGYASCCVAGVIGHIYIIQALTKPQDKAGLTSTYKILLGILGLGLTLSFFGTMLGGIWADQSWGRFWGWDPKENGALLIVLWCAIIFHAKIARLIGPLGVAVASVLGMVVVAWAWFGVNLLSVGLHSYGFTSGISIGLGAYVVGELIFLISGSAVLRKRLKS